LKSSKKTVSEHRAISERQRSKQIVMAINNAFDTLGPDMKQVLLFHLARDHEYVLGQKDPIVALSRALEKIFNEGGARMLMEQVYVEMDRLGASSHER
jgi:hypothetical protein